MEIFFCIVPLAVSGVFLFAIGKGLSEWAHNKSLPILTKASEVVAQRTFVQGSQDTGARTFDYATFEVEGGERLEFESVLFLPVPAARIPHDDARKRDGWNAKRLTPLLADLDQLLPRIHQWHPEIDPEFGETAGQSSETLLNADAHELGPTLEQIRPWEPPASTKGGRRKANR
ncbi:MAG: DUF2500 domain-containing protein [Planctomycetaceae bacterium]